MFLKDIAETAALSGLDLGNWWDFPTFLNKPTIDPGEAMRRGPGRQRQGGKGTGGKGQGARARDTEGGGGPADSRS